MENRQKEQQQRESFQEFNVTGACKSKEISLETILELERACYPPEWQYADALEYYQEMLDNQKAIHLFLTMGGETVGYLLAVPQNEVYDDLVKYDPSFTKEEGCYYLETIGIRPEYTGKGGGKILMERFVAVVQKKGIDKVSTHARTLNGFNGLVRQRFETDIVEARGIEHWYYGGGEPYEYIQWRV